MSGSRPGFDGLAFLCCASLREVVVPPTLQDLGIRAFCGCEQLTLFTKLDDPDTWRGVYAEDNTFLMCGNFERESWMKLLPPTRMPLMKSSTKGFTNRTRSNAIVVPVLGERLSTRLGHRDLDKNAENSCSVCLRALSS